jgi:hypothetical protein
MYIFRVFRTSPKNTTSHVFNRLFHPHHDILARPFHKSLLFPWNGAMVVVWRIGGVKGAGNGGDLGSELLQGGIHLSRGHKNTS